MARSSRKKAHKGIVVTLFAVILPVHLAMAGLCVDLGYLSYVRTRFQVAADATALAGAAMMHDSQGAGRQAAVDFAEHRSCKLRNRCLNTTFGWQCNTTEPGKRT